MTSGLTDLKKGGKSCGRHIFCYNDSSGMCLIVSLNSIFMPYISKIKIQSFKSLESVDVDLGALNVFIGANGSGKSNFLEGVGVLSSAADGRVNDQTLLMRGVRPGVPRLYKSSFKDTKLPPHISFAAHGYSANYSVSLHNPLTSPEPN